MLSLLSEASLFMAVFTATVQVFFPGERKENSSGKDSHEKARK